MSKTTPVYEMLDQNLIHFGIFNKLLSVDKSMVPYFGRHSAKIFIRGNVFALVLRFGAYAAAMVIHTT